MISRILIIAPGGILCYSKNFITTNSNDYGINEDLISGFLTGISSFAQEIKGGEIKSLNFRNFNFLYSYEDEFGYIFVIITDIDDLEEEARIKLELMKNEFISRYNHLFKDFIGNVSNFYNFDEFVDKNIFIPPTMLLIGEIGVGKSTIMDLFPGETILELDEDLNEIIEKTIGVAGLENLKQFKLREIDLKELIENSKFYRRLLDTIDIICIVTNSAASNLGRTQRYYSRLKKLVKKADFYIIANFQDQESSAFEPDKIEESFGIRTYGFSAIQKDSKEKIFSIITEILKTSVLEKIKVKQQQIF